MAQEPLFSQTVFVKLHRAAAAIEKRADRALKVGTGLTFSQFMMLSAIRDMGESSQRELAQELGVTPAVISRQSEAMIIRNIVSIKPVNKRENSLSLTPGGLKLLISGEIALRDITKKAALSCHEERVLRYGLDRLI